LQGRHAAEIAEKMNHCVARRAREKFLFRFTHAASQRRADNISVFETFATVVRRSQHGGFEKTLLNLSGTAVCQLAFP